MHVSEVAVRTFKREQFTVNERLAMLAEWEQCFDLGSKSALCRRLGIDPGSPRRWARAKRDGLLEPSDSQRVTKLISKRELAELSRLRRDNEALRLRLAQSESAVEVLGKASELLTALAKSSQLQAPPGPDPSAMPTSVEDGSASTPSSSSSASE